MLNTLFQCFVREDMPSDSCCQQDEYRFYPDEGADVDGTIG